MMNRGEAKMEVDREYKRVKFGGEMNKKVS